jgi:hypothetical protein
MSGPFGSSQWMYKSGGYEINNSSRGSNERSSRYIRTFGSGGSTRKYTISAWVKHAMEGNQNYTRLLNAYVDDNNFTTIGNLNNEGTVQYMHVLSERTGNSNIATLSTKWEQSDPNAWYHFVINIDTTQGTAANRVKCWINGTEVLNWTTANYPNQNADIARMNTAQAHKLFAGNADAHTGSGLLAEYHFLDGIIADKDSFGEYGDYGNWIPKKYDGNYGTTGFYLNFADSSAMGNDVSGNDNDFTATNYDADDQFPDTPTNNFCVVNYLDTQNWVNTSYLKEGNLQMEPGLVRARGSFAPSTGKWYYEVLLKDQSNSNVLVGIRGVETTSIDADGTDYIRMVHPSSNGSGVKLDVRGTVTDNIGAVENGDIIGIAYDMDNETISFTKNGSAIAASLTDVDWSGLTQKYQMAPLLINNSGRRSIANFGQDSSFATNKTKQGNADGNGIGDFYYTPPSGYLALCTKNLPAPAVIPSEHFNTLLYTADDGSDHDISGVGFQPDFVFIKGRESTADGRFFDAVRGANKTLTTTSSLAEFDENTVSSLTSFDADGFNLGSNNGSWNAGSRGYVAWNWKANGSGSSNTNGTITSTVSANVDAGFSIVSYTGNGTNDATIGHGLSKAPDLMIVKSRVGADAGTHQWYVYEGTSASLYLESTEPLHSDNRLKSAQATTFTVSQHAQCNASGDAYIGYMFHSVEGYSKVGHYTGNGGSANNGGVFVYTGFKPAWIIRKITTGSNGSWHITDNKRDGYNGDDSNDVLLADTNAAEVEAGRIDLLSNGFKIRTTDSDVNADGSTYVYMAFAETPLKYATAR